MMPQEAALFYTRSRYVRWYLQDDIDMKRQFRSQLLGKSPGKILGKDAEPLMSFAVRTSKAVVVRTCGIRLANKTLVRLQGIFYFLSHRSLWRPLTSRLLPTIGLSVGVVASMFTFTYVPQVALLAFVNGPLAVFTAVLLILSESATIISILSRNFLLQDALLDTFDGTLMSRDATEIVSEGRQLKSGADPMARLGKVLKSPFAKFSPKALIRYVMYLPLNFIPGTSSVPDSVQYAARAALWATCLTGIPYSCRHNHLHRHPGTNQRKRRP